MSNALKRIKPIIMKEKTFITIRFFQYLRRYWFLYLLVLPGLLHTFVFKYVPMYGLQLAFKDFNVVKGIFLSPWVGLDNFKLMFQDPYFYRVVFNTLLINIYNILFGFTFIVFLSLIINELKNSVYKKTVQTFIYLPHFISWVVFAGLVMIILSPTNDGLVNNIISLFGVEEPLSYLTKKSYFKLILVVSNIIKEAGFGTIIYLAALSGVNPELYESAVIDGAHRGQIIWHINLPRIMPTIAVLLILNFAKLFASNFDQVFNLYNPAVYETGDVLSTYLYRTGLMEGNFEMATAIGLVFNLLGLITVIIANKVISKMNVMGIF